MKQNSSGRSVGRSQPTPLTRKRLVSSRRPSSRFQHRVICWTGIPACLLLIGQTGSLSYDLSSKRRTAAAAARRIRIRKRKARAHHSGDVVDLDTVQILTTEHIDEEFDAA